MATPFSQATAVFDHIGVEGARGPWRHDDVGVTLEADGRTPHHPGAATESDGKITVTGSGDIGPATVEGGIRADFTLLGATAGLILVIVAAAAYATTANRDARPLPAAGATAGDGVRQVAGGGARRLLAARAAVAGVTAFAAGLMASGVVIPAGLALLRANHNRLQPLTTGTELRMIAGYAALAAAAAVPTVGIAALVRRRAPALALAVTLVVVPELAATAGLTPWLPALTPAAGFAIVQSVPTYPHVDVEQSVLGLYHPLPPWAGLAVTCAYAALTLALAAAKAAHRR